MQMNLKVMAAIAAAVCGFSASANADEYQLKFETEVDSGIVNFTTAGPWTSATAITGVNGEIDGSAILGLSSYAGADNTLYDSGPHLSFGGVAVSTAADTYNFSSDPYLIVNKASSVPSGFVSIPGTELVAGGITETNAQSYQLNFFAGPSIGTAGSDSGIINFTTAGPWTSPTAITGVSGDIDGAAVTGLSSYAGADNTLYDTDPHLSFGGVAISTTADTFNFSDNPFLIMNKASTVPSGFVSIPGTELVAGAITDITPVPESPTWTLFVLGLGLIGYGARRRRVGAC